MVETVLDNGFVALDLTNEGKIEFKSLIFISMSVLVYLLRVTKKILIFCLLYNNVYYVM